MTGSLRVLGLIKSIFEDYFKPFIALESAAEYTDTEHVGTTSARHYSSISPGC